MITKYWLDFDKKECKKIEVCKAGTYVVGYFFEATDFIKGKEVEQCKK